MTDAKTEASKPALKPGSTRRRPRKPAEEGPREVQPDPVAAPATTRAEPAATGAAPESKAPNLAPEPEPAPKPAPVPDAATISRLVGEIAGRSTRVVSEFLARQNEAGYGDPLNIGGAFLEMTTKLMAEPTRLFQAQAALWQDYFRLWQQTTERFLSGEATTPVIATPKGDKRFRDAAWQENALFDFIKQSYLLSARFIQSAVSDVEGLDEKTARKVDFYTRQFVDALSPSNFALTNPEVIRTTLDTGGENLVKGLEHMLEDLERGKGQLAIKMTDPNAFRLGENIASTPGKVVYRNAMMELLQFAPLTESVYRRPLLIVPPWINKYYILDLKPQNSFIRWAVEQGHTVFVISWVNPDETLADATFERYMDDGLSAALDAINKITSEPDANVIGYCIGGTLLAASLGYMAERGDRRVASATYLTTLVDFSESGDLSVFIDEEQISVLEEKMREKGYLEGTTLAGTFNMLRANDLIWSFVVNNYLLGKEPFPFDLLYWNADATRLPCAMHSFYLRNMYQQNRLVRPGGISLHGTPIDLTHIDTPSYILATRDDHIVPWTSSYAATQLYRGPVRFCLAGSGHVAGVINPPVANKYGYWTNPKLPQAPAHWLEGASQANGSWWTNWAQWVAAHGHGQVPARVPGAGPLPALGDAPGTYVRKRAAA